MPRFCYFTDPKKKEIKEGEYKCKLKEILKYQETRCLATWEESKLVAVNEFVITRVGYHFRYAGDCPLFSETRADALKKLKKLKGLEGKL